MIACANKVHAGDKTGFGTAHHETVTQVRECFGTEGGIETEEDIAYYGYQESTYDPDAAYERHLEDRGAEETYLEAQHNFAMGLVDYQG